MKATFTASLVGIDRTTEAGDRARQKTMLRLRGNDGSSVVVPIEDERSVDTLLKRLPSLCKVTVEVMPE